ncbi:MAG: transcription-repair coupling factor [Actinomycetota bacterium]|nr:transcription-repair coupling factor [Actinomycetota bacterium]
MAAPLISVLKRFGRDLVPPIPGRFVVPPALRSVVLAGIADRTGRSVIGVVPGEREAEDLSEDVALFSRGVYHLPAWETLPFEHVSPSISTMADRIVARHALASDDQVIIVASVRAVTQRLSPTPVEPIRVTANMDTPFDEFVRDLTDLGYRRTDRVESRGEFAVRGGIIDVFSPQASQPRRIDFWGDTVEEIRSFAVSTQRSEGTIDEIDVFPAGEVLISDEMRVQAARFLVEAPWGASTWERISEGIRFQGIESWLPWLAPPMTIIDETDAIIVLFDPVRAKDRCRDLIGEEADLAVALSGTWGKEGPEAASHPPLYLSLEVGPGVDVLDAPPVQASPGDDGYEMRGFGATAGDPESVASSITEWAGRGIDVIIAMDGRSAAERVSGLLAESGAGLPIVDELDSVESSVLPIGIHLGFVFPAMEIAVVGEREVAGRRRAHRTVRKGRGERHDEAYRDLNPGDFVVHHHHGVGRFEGLVHRDMTGAARDYLLVEYAAGDRLYVPTDQLAAVRRYTGGETPRLSRMGGTDWSQTRKKVRKEIAVVAEAVVELHRTRAAVAGHAFDPDTPWQGEFEAAFPYEETPDQLTAIADVKRDMEFDAPMDRLVFGDVGFGKTEVALRAVFKAVQDGKQAAILVPTTLLAQQHFATMEERFAPFPIRVEVLSRFLTPSQQRKVIAGIADGSVDAIVGTHRLLSADVEFNDLGLLVVDEEQRFGVSAKDKLKALRASVDVLTLTATPIPRTLEMALTGIREVSKIRTAPEDRHPILTYVGPNDEQAVSAAIRREMLREGQVFYVHNRVQSIDHAVARLRDLVPDARYAVAHGQMSEGQLEQVMYDFWNGDYDVLVATTIIESGLDLPQVNTLIVERADRLGLAQLYQLRGRVGRSSQRAYAYLFHPPEERIGENAYRRLEAIGEFSDLGSGFELAMRDLEIRGAGSILSETQSGQIAAVGFDLYTELVAEAVRELKGETVVRTEKHEIRIDLPLDARLTDAYVPDADGRLEAYRRLAAAVTEEEVDDVVSEWEDRFGSLPVEAAELISVARLRVEALRIGLDEIVQVRDEVRLSKVDLRPSQEVRLERIQRRGVIRGSTLFIPAPTSDVAAVLLEFLRTMWPTD